MGAAIDLERLAQAVRNPGRFVVAPVPVAGRLAGAFPFGGTDLGPISQVELDWLAKYEDVDDPASGVHVETECLDVEVPRIHVLIQGPSWDEDVIAAACTKTTAGRVASPVERRIEGTLIPRALISAWNPILFAPDDPNHKAVLFRRPEARLSLRKSVAFAQRLGAGLPIVFLPTPDDAWATTPYWQIARMENLSL